MTDQQTDPKSPEQDPADQKNTVPEKAIAQVRARARAAEELAEQQAKELTELRAQLEVSKTQPAPTKNSTDVQALLDKFNNILDERLKPIEGMSKLNAVGRELGIDDEQAQAVLEAQEKYRGVDAQKALVLARMDKPELFSGRGQQPAKPGMLPPSISSPMRTQTTKEKTFNEVVSDLRKEKAPQEVVERAALAEIPNIIRRQRERQRR